MLPTIQRCRAVELLYQAGRFAMVVILPKFSIESKFELKEVLGGAGMPLAFNLETADFSGMINQKGFAISKVIHKARAEVDERGTVAAAVTVSNMLDLEDTGEPIHFQVDRPFLFVITERTSRTVLFMGSIVEPVIEQDAIL